MPIKVLGDLKALGKKKPTKAKLLDNVEDDLKPLFSDVAAKVAKKTKGPKKPAVEAPAPEPVAPPVQVKTSANPAGKAELTITLPLVQETPAYLGVTHEGKTIWLAKASLVRFSLSGGSARFTMTRQQASRRGLLGKVESTAQAA